MESKRRGRDVPLREIAQQEHALLSSVAQSLREEIKLYHQTRWDLEKKVESLRARQLEAVEHVLESAGLIVCAEQHNGKGSDEAVGLVPAGEARHVYRSWLMGGRGSEYSSGWEKRVTERLLLCPGHYTKMGFQVSPASDGRLNICSPVVERDGRLVTEINKIDVTDVPLKSPLSADSFFLLRVNLLNHVGLNIKVHDKVGEVPD